jgi:hypothetical protein
VAVGGRIVDTDPVVIDTWHDGEDLTRLTVVGLDPDVGVREGATLRVFGTVEPDRTLRAANAFVVPPIGRWYSWSISFLAGLWVLGRIVRRFRIDRVEWGLVRRERPLSVRSLLGGERSGGGEDA